MRWLTGWCGSQLYASRASTCGSTPYHILNNGNLDGVSQATRPRLTGCPQSMQQNTPTMSRRFGQPVGKEEFLSRDWLARLWRVDERGMKHRRRRQQLHGQHIRRNGPIYESPLFAQFMRSLRSRPILDQGRTQSRTIIEQTPIYRSVGGSLSPSTPEEVQLAPLLARGNLVIVRDIEWANIMLAFEQESRYVIMDACYPQSPVGFIREKSNVIFRQLLRSRRPFIASIIDALGNEIFRVRRPFWLINSSIYAEVDGKEVGVVHRRWHLWRRVYDLYLGNKQFAVVENPGFWNWTFTLKDENDNVLAQIDRDWRGLGLELFTDAGQYVIRFGDADSSPAHGQASPIQELEVVRPLTLSERAVAVALAISLDCDYFSRRGGWGVPILIAGE